MKKQKIAQKQPGEWQTRLFLNFFLFVWRTLTRLFFLTFYATLALPWIIIFGADTESGIGRVLFKFVAFLSGNPGAESLNEGELAAAVIILFVVGDILYELYMHFRGKSQDSKFEAQRLKRRMYVQGVISITSWSVLAVVEYDPSDPLLSVIFFVFGIIFAGFFLMEYNSKMGYQAMKKTLLG